MKSSIERISPVECRIKVEIPWTDISSRLDGKMRDLRRRARIPGFRPGKVPPAMLERRFGAGIRQELTGELLQETFMAAVTEHETQPLTAPLLEDSSLERNQPFTYEARFEVRPQLTPTNYKGVEVRRRPVSVTEEAIDARVKELREKMVELRPLPADLERTQTEAGDVWIFDLDGTFGTAPIAQKDVKIKIGGGEQGVPGLAAQLEELQLSDVGSVKELRYVPPADTVPDAQKNQEVAVKLALREVKTEFLPELDDEFAKDTGDAETMQELRTKLRAELEEQDAREAESQARERLVDTLLDAHPFDPAPSLVDRQIREQIEQHKRMYAQYGMTLAQMGMSEQTMAREFREGAVRSVRAFLLLDAIGKRENIEASDEEVDAKLKELAAGQSVERLRAAMEKSGRLAMVRAEVRQQNIFAFLMNAANVTEAPDPDPQAAQSP